MWRERSPDEIAAWRASKTRAARLHAALIALGVSAVATLVIASGWVLLPSAGITAQIGTSSNLTLRLAIAALIGATLGWRIFRKESHTALHRWNRLTICPDCENAREGHHGVGCPCGGHFIAQSRLEWVEPEER